MDATASAASTLLLLLTDGMSSLETHDELSSQASSLLRICGDDGEISLAWWVGMFNEFKGKKSEREKLNENGPRGERKEKRENYKKEREV